MSAAARMRRYLCDFIFKLGDTRGKATIGNKKAGSKSPALQVILITVSFFYFSEVFHHHFEDFLANCIEDEVGIIHGA